MAEFKIQTRQTFPSFEDAQTTLRNDFSRSAHFEIVEIKEPQPEKIPYVSIGLIVVVTSLILGIVRGIIIAVGNYFLNH